MSNSVEYIYSVIDRFSSPLRRFNQATDRASRITSAANQRMRDYGRSMGEAGAKMRNFGAGMTAAVTAPIVAMGASSLSAAAQIETLTTNFESLLGGADKAQSIMNDLKSFSAKTPFQLPGIANTAKMLLGFGVSQDEIIEKLKMLGDVASGTGRSLGEIGLIFGQIKAKGKLQGEELLQLAERGIPILDVLAKKYGVSTARIQKAITAGKISFKMVDEAIKSMTTGTGIFADQMQRQSTTLGGLWSTLKDNFFLFNASLGETLETLFGVKDLTISLTETLQEMTSGIKQFVAENPKLSRFIAIGVGILAVLGPILAMVGLVTIGIGGLSSAVGFVGGALSLLLSPIALIIAAVAAVAAGAWFLYENWDEVVSRLEIAWGRFANSMKETFKPAIDFVMGMIEKVSSAISSMTGFLGNAMSFIGFGSDDQASVGLKSSEAATRSEMQRQATANSNLSVSGQINVSADKGSNVTSSNIGLNSGSQGWLLN